MKLKSKGKRFRALSEWLVKCAESHNTRIEGYYEFRDPKFFRFIVKHLRKKQKTRLVSAFFELDTISYYDLYLTDLIESSDHTKLRKFLLNNLLLVDFYNVEDIMEKVLEITPNDELEQILDQANDLYFRDNQKEIKQKQLIERFIQIGEKIE